MKKATAYFIFVCLSLCLTSHAVLTPPDPKTLSCPLLSEKIDDTEMQILDLQRTRDELSAKFKDLVVDDVKAQAEGLLDEVQKNEAIKVSYTRRKLTKSIDDKTAFVKAVREEYCVRCATSIKNEFAKASFCAKCPGKIDCDLKPPEEGDPKDS